MKILDDLIAALNFNDTVKDIRQGVFHTGVLTRHCGLAATLPRDALRQTPPLVIRRGKTAYHNEMRVVRNFGMQAEPR